MNMATAIILMQFAIVLALIFKGARIGGIGLGIYGMVGVLILVFGFGMKPGNLPERRNTREGKVPNPAVQIER